MTYEELIETVSFIVENPKIQKKGLSLTYELSKSDHLTIQESVFMKTNPYATTFIPSDDFEVLIAGVLVKFIKIFVK